MPDPRLATLRSHDYGRIYTHPVTREEHVSTTTVLKLWPKTLDRWGAECAVIEAYEQRDWFNRVTLEQAVSVLKGAPERARNKAGTHGTLVHDGAHWLAMRAAGWELQPEDNQKLTMMLLGHQGESVKQALFRFSEWASKYVSEWLYLEQTTWGNGWAGTFDAIVRLHDGRIVLVDYKTGKSIFPEIKLQFASYRYAPIILNAEGVETPMPDIDLCAYLHLPQVGGYSFKDVQTNETDLATFERLLLNWYWDENVPPNFGVAIPIAAAPRVAGVRDCGVRKLTARGNPGTIACIRPEGHDGLHHGKDAKTGSRNYHWSDQDVPGADAQPPSATPGVPPDSLAQRPVLNVLEGGGSPDSSDIAVPLQDSKQLPPPGLTNEEMIQWWKNKQAGLDPETGDNVPGPATVQASAAAPGSGGSLGPVPALEQPWTESSGPGWSGDGQITLGVPELDEAEAHSAKTAALFLQGPGVEQ